MLQEKEVKESKQYEDKGALWAILLTVAMVAVMAILKQFLG